MKLSALCVPFTSPWAYLFIHDKPKVWSESLSMRGKTFVFKYISMRAWKISSIYWLHECKKICFWFFLYQYQLPFFLRKHNLILWIVDGKSNNNSVWLIILVASQFLKAISFPYHFTVKHALNWHFQGWPFLVYYLKVLVIWLLFFSEVMHFWNDK